MDRQPDATEICITWHPGTVDPRLTTDVHDDTYGVVPPAMLTDRQSQILRFIETSQRERGYPPTTVEIQKRFGFASRTAVVGHLEALKRKGYVHQAPGKARALVVRGQAGRAPVVDVPLMGTVPAGRGSESTGEAEGCIGVDLDTLGIPRSARTFALRVRGDSMVEAGIYEGDIVVMEHRPPVPGDIVAALIDGEATLKRYLVQRGKPYLKAENPNYSRLVPAHDLVLQGVLVLLLRQFRGTRRAAA